MKKVAIITIVILSLGIGSIYFYTKNHGSVAQDFFWLLNNEDTLEVLFSNIEKSSYDEVVVVEGELQHAYVFQGGEYIPVDNPQLSNIPEFAGYTRIVRERNGGWWVFGGVAQGFSFKKESTGEDAWYVQIDNQYLYGNPPNLPDCNRSEYVKIDYGQCEGSTFGNWTNVKIWSTTNNSELIREVMSKKSNKVKH